MPNRSPHPYVVWRDGRPRFSPSPVLRRQGHKGMDLKHRDGTWFSRGECVDWSDVLMASIKPSRPEAEPATAGPAASRSAAERASQRTALPAPPEGRPKAELPVRQKHSITLAQLFDDWFCSAKFQLPEDPRELARQVKAKAVYAPRTVRDFRQKARVLETFDTELWWAPAGALTTPVVYGVYEGLRKERGIATARGAIAVLSIALKWGRKRGKVSFRLNDGANPAHDLDMATPPPRVRVATRIEIETLVAVADRIGRPEAGDMIMLGVWTGQRQGDRLALEDKGLIAGRRVFRQSKTGATVAIKQVPELTRRLAAAQERRRKPRAEAMLQAPDDAARAEVERRFRRVILNELVDSRYGKCLWRTFEGQTYSHLFAEIRAIAVAGVPKPGTNEWLIAPCPSLADFTDPDLRDTAVTWMALAGVDIPGICAVTGHSLVSATRILRHYLAMSPELADAAIGKMLAWYEDGAEVLTI
ncbi:hypothetical protein [Mesorhizobium sp. Z1-4]|uniref:hypothetical protein n=1 Tax=Mesorhizobium sp. Z1-4 TaxID=2448478 RepID=UPI000FDCA7FA|nr:hypothetical protein [Mesorhizobium sp. Z1-4]